MESNNDYLAREKQGKMHEPVNISYGSNVDTRNINAVHIEKLKDACRESKNLSICITSAYRTAWDQCRAMYNNLERSYSKQRSMYLGYGQKVIDVYDKCKEESKSRDETITLMARKADELGADCVSSHCSSRCVFDVGYSSLKDRSAFERAIRSASRKVLDEPFNSCIHVEM